MPAAADRASRTYRLAALLGLFGLGTVAILLAAGAQAITVRHHAVHTIHVLGATLGVPRINAAAVIVLPLAAVGATVTVRALRCALAHAVALRRLLAAIEPVGPLAADPSVTVFDDPRPAAFCAGYLRPQVFVSQGAVNALAPDELQAVLAHEAVHRRRRDPLRIACTATLGHALFFMPVLARLGRRHRALAELAADDAALARTAGDPTALAAAMVVFSDAAPSAAVGVAPERIDHLLGRGPQWSLPIGLALGSLAGLASLSLAAWQLGHAALFQATLNPPLLSHQPCVLVLALLPLAAVWARAAIARR